MRFALQFSIICKFIENIRASQFSLQQFLMVMQWIFVAYINIFMLFMKLWNGIELYRDKREQHKHFIYNKQDKIKSENSYKES